MNKKLKPISFIRLFLMLLICISASFRIPSIAYGNDNNSYYYMPDYSPIFWSGPNHKKSIALTFDDGPDPLYTPQILNILSKYNVKATFFLVGEMAKLNPQLVERMIAEGHDVESHTMTHPDATKVPPLKLQSEVVESIACLQDITKQQIRFFRPPYGYLNPAYFSACADQKLIMILWSVETNDWQRPPVDTIVQGVISSIQPGSIVLMHDGGGNRQHTVEALDKILSQLEQMQLQPVTLSKLFSEVIGS